MAINTDINYPDLQPGEWSRALTNNELAAALELILRTSDYVQRPVFAEAARRLRAQG